MLIAFYGDDVRTTGLVAHACVLLAEMGHAVAGVTGEHIPVLARYLAHTGISVLDASRADDDGYDVRVIEVRPFGTPPLTPDVWILPISRADLPRAIEAADRIEGRVIWLGVDGFDLQRADIPDYLLPGVHISRALPFSRALDHTWREHTIVWDDPELARSPGAAGLRDVLSALLDRALHPRPWDFFRVEAWIDSEAAASATKTAASAAQTTRKPPRRAPERVLAALPPPAPERQLSDPGLAALLERSRSLVAGTPCAQSPCEEKLARSIGRMTVKDWLVSLDQTGRELACGATAAEQIARAISPKAVTAEKAGIHASTLKRFLAEPERARLATLMRLAIVAGRVDLFEVRQRSTADPEPPCRVVSWWGPTNWLDEQDIVLN